MLVNARSRFVPPTVLFVASVVGCVGGIEDPDRFRAAMNGATAGRAGAACVVPVADLFAKSCAGAQCHSAGAVSVDLVSPGVAARVLSIPARSGGLLADPNHPEQSSLVTRLFESARGARMPIGAPPLSAESVACVTDWIADLAPPAPSSGPPEGAEGPSSTGPSPASPTPDAGPSIPTPAPGGTIVRVAVGRTTPYVDPTGLTWAADVGFTGGTTAAYEPPPAIAGTSTPELYQSERYGEGTQGFRYAFPVVKGRYLVTLKFAENYTTAPGERQFHVDVAGTRVLTSFDIVATAGSRHAAIDRDANVTMAADGSLEIVFVQSVEQPKISAIQIVPAP